MGSFLANVKFHVKNLEENCVGAQSKKTFLSWMCREKGQEKLNHTWGQQTQLPKVDYLCFLQKGKQFKFVPCCKNEGIMYNEFCGMVFSYSVLCSRDLLGDKIWSIVFKSCLISNGFPK